MRNRQMNKMSSITRTRRFRILRGLEMDSKSGSRIKMILFYQNHFYFNSFLIHNASTFLQKIQKIFKIFLDNKNIIKILLKYL